MKQEFYFLKIIEYFADKYNIPYTAEDRYFASLIGLRKHLKENEISLGEHRDGIIRYIYGLNIPNMHNNIFRILNPEVEIIEDGIYVMEDFVPEILSDTLLLKYLVDVLSVLTYNINGNLLQIKYNVSIWNTGFHTLAKWSRGKIIDLDTKEVVSYPFDKFFNLNEVPESSEAVIRPLINTADYIYATDKIDGSTIIVSKYKGKPLITTNGSFENDQTKWANELFAKKYPTFLPNMKDGFTYLFELVHPENKIVLDYHGESALYLLNIRDLSTCKLLPLESVHEVANAYGFPCPEVYDFKDIDTMIYLAHNLKDANKEGWVIRIGNAGEETMVKLKLDEYFEMHKAFGKVKLGWVYKHLIAGDLDDFIAICNDEQKNKIFEKLDIIHSVQEKIKDKARDEAEECLACYGIAYDDFGKDKSVMIKIIQELLSSKSIYKNYAVQYLKEPARLDYVIKRMFYKHMKIFFEQFGENVYE